MKGNLMKKNRTKTSRDQAHTPKSPKGMGDYYGTGIRQKMGRMISGFGLETLGPNELKKPPKSLA